MSLKNWIDKRKMELERGKEITLQKYDEKQRKKQLRYREPGTIIYGLTNKQDPLTFMKEAYERRKQNRQNKE
jgi:hypothetical protein